MLTPASYPTLPTSGPWATRYVRLHPLLSTHMVPRCWDFQALSFPSGGQGEGLGYHQGTPTCPSSEARPGALL